MAEQIIKVIWLIVKYIFCAAALFAALVKTWYGSGNHPKLGTLMTGHDIVHVAVAPPNMLEANLVKEVAAILNKDLYGTRLLLAGKIPRIVAHYQTIQAAESTAQSLRSLGLVTVVCGDSELRKYSSTSFKAHTLKLEKGEVIFRDRSGDTRRIKAENVFLIIKGTMRIHTEKEAIVTKMKFSVSATVLMGGIPIWRKVKEKAREGSIQTKCFVRLYERTSWDPILQIFQNDLDYSFLGSEMAASSAINLNTLVTELRNIFPRAVFDDRLTEPFGLDVPFAAPGDDIEINCKLIYLYHEAVSSLGPSA